MDLGHFKSAPGFVACANCAALVLSRDPKLETERGQALRHLLYLFGKDEAIKLIRAG